MFGREGGWLRPLRRSWSRQQPDRSGSSPSDTGVPTPWAVPALPVTRCVTLRKSLALKNLRACYVGHHQHSKTRNKYKL